jgi:aminoglycoside phosphotransferase family enzyme/predicted kinase
MTLPARFSALLTPAAYPHPADAIALIETPISWVLLAGDYAYKIKRPVRYGFIDLTDPVRRERLCEEELRLNRRFAPELYLEVCRIVTAAGHALIDGDGSVLEHAVRMRRFPSTEELDQLLEGGRIEPKELAAFGRELARIHAQLAVAAADSSWGQPAQIHALMIRNLLECAEAARALGLPGPVLALQAPLQRRLPRDAPVMAARRAAGRVRECHGDLHCRNIVRLAGCLIAFDCLEYEPAFRWIDVADEVAFLASDLAARDRPAHAHAFIAAYLEEGGDYQACRVLRLYEAHRALVRAKVAALSATGADDEPRQALRREHIGLVEHAAHALEDKAPLLILMHGLSGSGKTHLAQQLAVCLRAIHIRSDIERKRHAGLEAGARSGSAPDTGLYSGDTREAVYARLADAAEHALAGGYTVILDATFLRQRQRARFGELAGRCGVPARLVSCNAPEPVLRARIAARKAQERDPSDADEAVLGWQLSQQEPLASGEPFELVRIDTTDPQSCAQALAALRR